MVIPYLTYPDGLGSHMYFAMLRVQLALTMKNAPRTKRFEALIDSGATRCLFHSALANPLGIEIKSGILERTNGIGGLEETWLHDVVFYIPGGPVTIKAGFKENLPIAGLLGMSGFFEHYDAKFEGSAKQCVLERLYKA
jgi:hypothetical protein